MGRLERPARRQTARFGAAIALAASLALAPTARASPTAEHDADGAENDADGAGPLPVLVALVPGFVVSGAGTWVAGDGKTGRGLLRLQLLGLGVAAAGGIPLVATGASRRVAGFSMPLILTGSGIFLGSWIADIYGAATGGTDRGPWQRSARIESSAGLAYVYDPQFDYASFAVLDTDVHWARWRATPSAWIALGDDTQRGRAEFARRFDSARDTSFIELQGAATLHRMGDFDTTVWTGEVSALVRYDMARFGRTLRGSYLEIGAGFGLEIYDIGDDSTLLDLPLARAGYGMTLGRGEVEVFYDHRHDEFTGGLGTGGSFDGPYGHLGAEGFYYVTDRWGLELQLEAGAAYTGRLSVLWAN